MEVGQRVLWQSKPGTIKLFRLKIVPARLDFENFSVIETSCETTYDIICDDGYLASNIDEKQIQPLTNKEKL